MIENEGLTVGQVQALLNQLPPQAIVVVNNSIGEWITLAIEDFGAIVKTQFQVPQEPKS